MNIVLEILSALLSVVFGIGVICRTFFGPTDDPGLLILILMSIQIDLILARSKTENPK